MKRESELDKYFYIIGWICIGMMGAAGIVVQFYGDRGVDMIPQCFFHLMTGYYCPGCGGTRALKEFVKGHFIKSLFYNPFVGYVVLIGSWFMISQTIEHLSKGAWKIALHFRQAYMWIGILLIMGNCLIKNGVKLFMGISLMK